MEKLSFWNRLCGIAISAGMLTSVLFFCGCRTSKVSSTAVRSDSTRYSVTVVSTIEPVRTKTTGLVLTPDNLTRLTQLPKGFSIQASPNEDGGADVLVESDGNGGLNIVAEKPQMVLKKDSIVYDVETHIRDETVEKKETKYKELPLFEIWIGMLLFGIVLHYIKVILNNH